MANPFSYLDDLIRRLGGAAPPPAGGPYGFDMSNADDLLRRAVVKWKGNPSEVVLHAQDALMGLPPPPSASGLRTRAMAAALLDAVEQRGALAPTLYRGDVLEPSRNTSPLIGWTASPDVARQWARHYGGDVYPLEGARGLRLLDIVGDTFDAGEDEWIVRHFGTALRPRNKTGATGQ